MRPQLVNTDMETPWEEIHVSRWTEFDTIVKGLRHREWLFRGHHSSEYRLETSLYRLFQDLQPILVAHYGSPRTFAKDKHEKLLIKRFQANAHLHTLHLPQVRETLEWLAIMQHHGAPTRLLDVTLSPHIATYFALDSGHGDSAVFAFNHARLKAIDEDVFEGKKLVVPVKQTVPY